METKSKGGAIIRVSLVGSKLIVVRKSRNIPMRQPQSYLVPNAVQRELGRL